MHIRLTVVLGSFLTLAAVSSHAQSPLPVQLTVDTTHIVSPVSPVFYGLMTEEINHSYEGGLYAEMVNNRTFRAQWDGVAAWGLVRNGDARASYSLDKTDGPSNALPTSLKLTATHASPGSEAGLSNVGWWGMALNPHTTYRGSLYARIGDNDPGPLTAQLISDTTGKVLASTQIALKPGPWARYEYTLTTDARLAPAYLNHLQLTVAHPGTVSLQLVSLFPPTYHDRPNGLRPDLMQAMAQMRPTFLRLPGGNYLEGDRIADRYAFKNTIGPLVNRPGHQAPWTYWSTDGLGFLEFLEWCEDLRIQPLLAVYAGYSLKGAHVNPGADLQPYVDDALDEIEYVTGGLDTKWGKQRAQDGHPAPFPLTYIEIGNEDWFDKSGSYPARFAQFALAIRKKYPQYKLITTAPLKDMKPGTEPDILDDHYYKAPADMFDLVHHYDNAPRNGPKIFAGEWATRSGSPTPNFGDALGDAAWMTSMERNADLIIMASYAPLLVNVNPGGMQWATDLIGFNAQTWYASPSYWAQVLFARSLGDQLPRITVNSAPGGPTQPGNAEGESAPALTGDRFFYSATLSSATDTLHLKLVNASTRPQPVTVDLVGAGPGAHTAKLSSLHGPTFMATNTIVEPSVIKPVDSTFHLSGNKLTRTVAPLTIEVIDIPLR